jgi:hypothetical protein
MDKLGFFVIFVLTIVGAANAQMASKGDENCETLQTEIHLLKGGQDNTQLPLTPTNPSSFITRGVRRIGTFAALLQR